MANIGDMGVRITFRNKDLKPTYTRTYSLREYTGALRADLLRLVSDVEALCYAANNDKDKSEWSEETFKAFNLIKHKLLDKAGDIGRLPDNLVESKTESLTELVARILNEGEGDDLYGESRLGPDGGYPEVHKDHSV